MMQHGNFEPTGANAKEAPKSHFLFVYLLSQDYTDGMWKMY